MSQRTTLTFGHPAGVARPHAVTTTLWLTGGSLGLTVYADVIANRSKFRTPRPEEPTT